MNNNIYISLSNNPYFNIALEYELLKKLNKINLFLWINNPSVIIGKNQSYISQVNLDYIKKNNINLVRRFSGGGSVYHDLNNLNYTLYCKDINDYNIILDIIIKSLNDFNLYPKISGRNDLLINNKKFSGFAYLEEDNKYLFHGTLMVNVNIINLMNSLKVNNLKLLEKGIDSISKRVINLNQFNSNITIKTLQERIIYYFQNKYNSNIIYIDDNYETSKYDLLKSNRWIYNENPDETLIYEYKLKDGLYTIKVVLENNIVKKLNIYTDSLKNKNFNNIEKYFNNKVFELKSILSLLKND